MMGSGTIIDMGRITFKRYARSPEEKIK